MQATDRFCLSLRFLYFFSAAFLVCVGPLATAQVEPIVEGRIVGGTKAAINAAPYIVSIQYHGVHYCAGSIINNHWILTAAHCLTKRSQVFSSMIIAGSNNVHGTATTTQKRAINYFVMHDLFNGGIAPYDIGLIYTSNAFTWTVAVKPIKLPASGSNPTGNANLYGWGSISTTKEPIYPTDLQVITLPIIPLTVCENALGAKGNDVHVTNICTGPLTGGAGICNSDSGGPLVQSTTLVGIVSWGKMPCGQKNAPSVFVKVSDFIPWINENQVLK